MTTSSAPAPAWEPDYPIRTSRLSLRPHRLDDLDDLVLFHGDPEVTRYIPWPVRTREQTREALVVKLDRDVARAEGDWIVLAMEELSTATVVGEVLLKRGPDRRSELGYALRTDRHGLGLATEAAAAMVRLAFEEFDQLAVEAMVERENAASARLLTRMGFVRERTLDLVEDGVLVDGYLLSRQAWAATL